MFVGRLKGKWVNVHLLFIILVKLLLLMFSWLILYDLGSVCVCTIILWENGLSSMPYTKGLCFGGTVHCSNHHSLAGFPDLIFVSVLFSSLFWRSFALWFHVVYNFLYYILSIWPMSRTYQNVLKLRNCMHRTLFPTQNVTVYFFLFGSCYIGEVRRSLLHQNVLSVYTTGVYRRIRIRWHKFAWYNFFISKHCRLQC